MIVIIFVRWEREESGKCRINTLAPKFEVPVNKLTAMLIDLGVFDNYSPCADARLAPLKVSNLLPKCGKIHTNEQHS